MHLGTKGCQVGQLLHFLVNHDAETIYLVGDIIDAWRLDVRWYWPDEHNAVLRLLKRKAEQGTRIVYLPGNHDEFVRQYVGSKMATLEIEESVIHEAADGKRYLVVHGDCFDPVQSKARWLAFLGDNAYVAALGVNTVLNRVGRVFGLPYWSFSNWAKMRVKGAVNFIGPLRRKPRFGCPRERRRRRHLRPHPPCRRARRIRACATSTAVTGWNRAPPPSSMRTAAWKSSAGPTSSRRPRPTWKTARAKRRSRKPSGDSLLPRHH